MSCLCNVCASGHVTGRGNRALGGREGMGVGWQFIFLQPNPCPWLKPWKKARVAGNHLQVDGVSWQLGPCLQSVGVVPADTPGITPWLGFLKLLDWWQWFDVDSAYDGEERKIIFCWTPNTVKGKFNRSNVNASALLPVSILNACACWQCFWCYCQLLHYCWLTFFQSPQKNTRSTLWLMSPSNSVMAGTGSWPALG